MLRRAALLILLCAAAACARPVTIGSGNPALNYSVEITNQTGTAMIVTYDDGRGDAMLGTVGDGRTERYIVASPASTTITVRGAAVSGSRSAGPYTVNLAAGTTARVTLR